VLYGGKVVENAERHRLFADPRHPYTHGLLGSVPRLDSNRSEPLSAIRGSVNDNIPWSEGCAFAPRCDHAIDTCVEATPALEDDGLRLLRCFNPVVPAQQGAKQ
jgi:peptide/nickel transport system ATP-binding protein